MRKIRIVTFPLLIFFLIALEILSGFALRIREAEAAISYVGSANTTGNNPTSGSFSLPAGWAPGDVAIFWWYTRTNTKTLVAGTPWGITTKRDVNATNYGHIFIGYRVLQSGDSTFAWTSSNNANATTIWGTSVFRGVDGTGDPFEAESGAPAGYAAENPDPPAVTTVSNNAYVVPIFGKNDNYTSITVPTNYLSAGENSSTAGTDASAGVAYREIASPTTEDPGVWTLGAGGLTPYGYVWTGALKPILPPDFTLTGSTDITFSNDTPGAGEDITIYAVIHNNGASYSAAPGFTNYAAQGNGAAQATAGSYQGTYYPYNANDGSITTGWASNVGTDWVKIDMNTARYIKKVAWDDTMFGSNNQPGSFTISLSANDSDWTEVASESGYTQGTYTKTLDNFVYARYIKMDVTARVGGNAATLGELMAYDCVPITVNFYDGDPDASGTQINGTSYIDYIAGDSTGNANTTWTAVLGSHDIYVYVDRADKITEVNENNNKDYKNINVVPAFMPKQKNWRWYNDEANVTPTISLGAENTSVGIALSGAAVKLRVTLTEVGGLSRDNVRMRLQYSTDDVNFYNVGEIGSGEIWRYYNGGGVDDAALPSCLLSDALIPATHNESGTASSTYDFAASSTPEFEFTIQNNGASVGQTYYFRVWDNSSNAPVGLVSGKSHPRVVTAVGESYGEGFYLYNRTDRIAKGSDGTIYTIYERRASPGAVRTADIARSKDNGETWESSWQTASNGSYTIYAAAMAIDGANNLHVAWSDTRTNPASLYYRRWNASSTSWDDELLVHTGVSKASWDSNLAVDSNNYVYLLFDADTYALHALRSAQPYNSTNSFSTDLAPPSTVAQAIEMVLDSNNNLHVMFYDYGTNISQRYLKYDGAAWSSPEYQVSDNSGSGDGLAPNGACDMDNSGKFHAIWRNNRPPLSMEFKYRNRDSGGTWSSPVVWASTSTVDRMSFDVGAKNDGSIIYVIYWDDDGNLQYTKSTDGGSNWDSPVLLSGGGNNYHPDFFGAYWPSYNRVTDRLDYVWQKGSGTFYYCYNYITTAAGDTIPPAAITNLSALTGDSEGEVKLTWSAPGDDDWDNPISGGKYGIKYATYTPFDFNGPSGFNLDWSTNTTPGASETKVVTSLTPGTTYYFRIWTADEVLNWSGISNGATTWAKITVTEDTTPPAAITDLTGLCDSGTGEVTLFWSTPGDDDWNNPLDEGSKYIIDYSSYSIQWSTATFDVEISTSGVDPHTQVSHTITGLTGDTTWYFQIWTRDEVPTNWSGLSNGATVWVCPILSISISTNTYDFGGVPVGQSTHTVSIIAVTNDGNVKQTYSLRISSVVLSNGEPSLWEVGTDTDTAPANDKFLFYSIFHGTNVALNYFKPNDITTEDNQTSTSERFTHEDDGSYKQTGENVPPGEERKLWFRLDMPTGVTTAKEEKITVTISAEKSP